MTVRVAINGFGRIGRNILRAISRSGRTDIEVVAVNDLGPVETNAHLLRYDSVHGRFPHEVTVDGDTITVGSDNVQGDRRSRTRRSCRGRNSASTSRSNAPASSPRRTRPRRISTAGAKRVIVSAPADGADLTVVYGVNHDKLTKDHIVISNALLHHQLPGAGRHGAATMPVGIEKGIMTTIHSYTGDQPTLDTMHKDLYRARAAALSMIPTSTGAAKAVGLVLPELKGKLDGISIRVPTPNVSVVDFKFVAKRATTVEEVNDALIAAAERPAQGHPRLHRRAAGLDRLQPQPAFVDLRARPDQGHRRQLRARHVLVRQRVGLLQPHGRHRRRHGQDHRLNRGADRLAATPGFGRAFSFAGAKNFGPDGRKFHSPLRMAFSSLHSGSTQQ